MRSTKTDPQLEPKLPDQVEVWSIDRLIPYTKNPRKNNSAVDQMCASIREFGFKIPGLAWTDGARRDYVPCPHRHPQFTWHKVTIPLKIRELSATRHLGWNDNHFIENQSVH